MRIIYSHRARGQIADIHDYIARDKPRAATTMVGRISAAIERLGSFPDLGRPGQVDGTRELLISASPYLVVYVVERHAIRVMAVIHGAQRR